MTIEDAIEDIRIHSGSHLQGSKNLVEKAQVYIQGYEAKEAQLEGDLVIPKGWHLIGIDQLDTNEFDCGIARDNYSTSKIKVSGNGTTIIKALRKALKQIEGGEGE